MSVPRKKIKCQKMPCSNCYVQLSDQEFKMSAFRRLDEHLKDREETQYFIRKSEVIL